MLRKASMYSTSDVNHSQKLIENDVDSQFGTGTFIADEIRKQNGENITRNGGGTVKQTSTSKKSQKQNDRYSA